MTKSREPVKHTCPDIDKAIECIRSAIELSNNYDNEKAEDLANRLYQIQSELWGLEDVLNDLRRSNQALRDWGMEEAERVDQLEEEIEQLTAV